MVRILYKIRYGVSRRLHDLLTAGVVARRRLDGPTLSPNNIEANVAHAATAAPVLRAVPAMPNGDFPLRLALGAPLRSLGVNALRPKRAGDFVLAGQEAREGLLVRAVPRSVPNDMRHVKPEPARLRLARLVAFPSGIADM